MGVQISYLIKGENRVLQSLILFVRAAHWLQAHCHKISAYHLQSNGLDERFNQTLKAQLQKMVNDHQDDWDDLLENILFAYHTSRQGSMKCTPA